jgi:hypothetical protein
MHFPDNSKQNEFQGPPKLFSIFPVIHHLNNKFQNCYFLNQNIALDDALVDEPLTIWKGHLSFRQYIPLKAAKFGIKSYEL